MKKINIVLMALVFGIFSACTNDEGGVDLSNVAAPKNISALTTIKQDNSGNVTFTPRGEGVTKFEIYFGDQTTTPVTLFQGESFTHKYAEGSFNVKIVGYGIDGKKTESTQTVDVSFLAPTDFAVKIDPVLGDNFSIKVSAKAKLETYFQVYFGDQVNEVPTDFIEGDEIKHTYANVGTYPLKVVALSGGVAKTIFEKDVVIANPVLLPLNFEQVTPSFTDFGGAAASVVANPMINEFNPSAKVGKFVKTAGAEIWAGSIIELKEDIDFANFKHIKVKVWSPKAGIVVKLKVENLTDGNINKEVDVHTTVTNNWEELSFDFTGINTANSYKKLIIFFDFGNAGDGSSYYFDDFKLYDGKAVSQLPATFETDLDYNIGYFGGAGASVVANPNKTGINTTNKVVSLTKGNGAEVWAGCTFLLNDPINFNVLKKIKIKVWSPKAGAVVKFKLENKDNNAINIEKDATTTTSNAWEELTYDFTGIVSENNYQRIAVFFDFGKSGDNTTYYFDDVKQSN